MPEPTNNLPPHNQDSEEATLGSLLIDPDSPLFVRDWLSPDDFYIGKNRAVCQAIFDLFDKNEPIDIVSIGSRLERNGSEVDTGYLINLTTAVPTAINVRQYARHVCDLSIRRKMIQAAQKVATLAYDKETDIDAQMDEAEKLMMDIRKVRTGDIGLPSVYAREFLDEITRRGEMDTPLVGPTTSLTDLDELIGGFEAGQMHIIAARPKMGKSALLMQAARVNAERGKRVLYFSLEMTKNQLMTRNVATITGLPTPRLRVGKIYEDERKTLYEAIGHLSTIPLYIDDTKAVSPAQVSAKARRIYAEFGLDLVMIDYIGLMSPPTRIAGNRNAEITDTSAALVKLAGDFNVPVVVASQLNRSVEQRSEKRPMLSDLRDSGSLEQDAYTVTFIYRDDYYNPDTSVTPGLAELIVAANRGGPAGKVDCNWNGERTLFEDRRVIKINL
jgi:replicative DNA helicase